jgi:ribose/xylose/arabinose/galactoside ABC-type transport system permease subunit
MLKGGWKSIGKVFIIAIILDLVFQYVAFKELRSVPGALVAGVILAIVPYLLLRGPINRLLGRKSTGGDR